MKLSNYRFRLVKVHELGSLDITFESRFLVGPVFRASVPALTNINGSGAANQPLLIPPPGVTMPQGFYSLGLSMAAFNIPGLDQRVDFTSIECEPGVYTFSAHGYTDAYSIIFYERMEN